MFTQEAIEELLKARQKYEEEVRGILDRVPGAMKEYETVSGIPTKCVYTPADIQGMDYSRDIGMPGEYPFTRGLFPAGFRTRMWNIRQVTGIGTCEENNQRWKYLLSQGMTALAVVGLGGYGPESDDERTIGNLGKNDVFADTLYDYETLFEGIDIKKIPIHLITSGPVPLAMYIAVAEKRGIPQNELRGSLSNAVCDDPDSLDTIEYCAKNMPYLNATYVDMRNVREAGATAPQEIAFGMALFMAAMDEIIPRGVSIDQIAPRSSWFVNSGQEFFEEVAKFRAMRRLWAKILKERYGAKDRKSLLLRPHVQTYAPTMTIEQPFNNIVRSTLYALAAVLGGVQSMSVNSFDESLASPTEFSATLSVRTQQMIYHETGIPAVVDPLGGSYYVEWLTNKLEEEANDIIETIEKKGGAFKACDWMVEQVRSQAYKAQQETDSGKRILVGLNAYREEEDIQQELIKGGQIPLHRYDPEIRNKQIARLNKVRRERDNDKVEWAKQMLLDAYNSGENIVPAMIEAVKTYMTQGEIGMVRRKSNRYRGGTFTGDDILPYGAYLWGSDVWA